MHKIFIILICLIFIMLSACDNSNISSHPDIEVNLPDGQITNNNESLPENINKDKVTVAEPDVIVDYYVGSSTTMKFHLKDCQWAQKMKEENKVYLSGYNEFIKQGYAPCKSCNP